MIRLADEGHSTSVIGMKLRDQYGIPSVKLSTGKSVLRILAENKRAPKLPEDLRNLMRKAVNLGDHLSENPKDLHNKRSFNLVEANIRKLVKYYKKKGVLPAGWKYDSKTAALMSI